MDVGEVAAADLEAVVCEAAAVDSVVVLAEAAAAEVSVEAVADSEEATEAEEAVVGVVAEAVEVTLMVTLWLGKPYTTWQRLLPTCQGKDNVLFASKAKSMFLEIF